MGSSTPVSPFITAEKTFQRREEDKLDTLTMPTGSHAFQLCLGQLIDVRMTNRTVVLHSIQVKRIFEVFQSVEQLPFGIITGTANHESPGATNNNAIVLRGHFHNHSRIAIFIGMFHFDG